jgi:D-psicose/D-tagatose/L-ribulose 3-epimerase
MNIKIGVNSLVWVLSFSEKDFGLIDKVKGMGFDVIELTPGDGYGKIDPDGLRKKIEDADLEVSLCGAFDDSTDISSSDGETRKRGIDHMKDYTDWASKVGAKVIGGPLYSELGKKRYLPDQERKAEWDRSVESLKRIGDDAAKKGVVIALEPINRFEIDMINTAEQGYAMCEQVDSPGVKLMLDTFHMNIEDKNIGESIRSSRKHLVHVHTCSNNRGVPGEGHIPWNEVKSALNEIDYDGYGVIESFAQGQVAAFANIWRPLVKNQDDIPARGVRFLKQLFA